jgi:hypothetical protein
MRRVTCSASLLVPGNPLSVLNSLLAVEHRSARHSRYSSTASKEFNTDNGLPGTSNDAEQVYADAAEMSRELE